MNSKRKLTILLGGTAGVLLIFIFLGVIFNLNISNISLNNLGNYMKAGVKNSNSCSSCDIVITSNQNNLTVPSGKTVCIMPGVKITGTITMQNNSTLCNQGQISTGNLVISNGSKIYNYGSLDADGITVNTNGALYNYNDLSIDNDLVLNNNATFENSHKAEIEGNLIVNSGATVNNSGLLEVEDNFIVNSGGTVNNTGQIIVEENLIINGTINNSKEITVEEDLIINSSGSLISPPGGGQGCTSVDGQSTINGCLGCNNLPMGFCDQSSSNGGRPDIINSGASIGNAIEYCNPSFNCGAPLPKGVQLSAKYENNELQFVWTPISSAMAYNLEYDKSPQFNNPSIINSFSAQENKYSTKPKSDMNGKVYFRITVATDDGSQITSNVVEINFEDTKADVKFAYKNGQLAPNKCLQSLQIMDLSGRSVYSGKNICEPVALELSKSQIYVIKYVDNNGNSGYKKIKFE